MDPILVQKQVRDNSEDLRSYLKELESWKDEMKRKESEFNYEGAGDMTLPTVRNKIKKTDHTKKTSKKVDDKESPKRIRSYDYKAWDKFDVDKELEKIDSTNKEETESSDNEEFDPSDDYHRKLRDEATYEKERGNQFVRQKKWNEAIACYSHAISCYAKDPIYYANRALCFLKKNDLHSAEADCTSALQFDPSYVKALQRRAAARVGLKQFEDALADLQSILDIEPNNTESKKEFARIEKILGRHKKEVPHLLENVSQHKTESEKKTLHPDKHEKELRTLLQEVNKKETLPKKVENNVPLAKESKKQEILCEKTEKNETLLEKTEEDIQHAIKIPWPVRHNAKPIIPIRKPPHQRSKKSLQRIEVVFENETKNNLTKDISKPGSSGMQNVISSKKEDSIIKLEEKISENTEMKTYNFPIPKTSVQFYGHWKTMYKNNEQKYLYLKKIDPSTIPNIFQESLESDLFCDIISILCEKFIASNLPVYQYLLNLSMVKRFSALTMFMSTSDKKNLNKLFEYCLQEVTKTDVETLKLKYEL